MPTEPGLAETRAELQSVKRLISAIVFLLILVTFSVDIYMMRQVTMVNRELAGSQNIIYDFTNRLAPTADQFWAKLNEYGKSHPDFAPVLAKYTNFVQSATVPVPKK